MKRPRPTAPSDAPQGTVRLGGEIEWFSVSLHVTSEELVPERVAELLGPPTASQSAGVPRVKRDGTAGAAPKFGRWSRTIKRNDTDEWDVAEAIHLLFEGLPSSHETWADVRALGRIGISVGLSLTAPNQEFTLDEELLALLAQRRASLWVDVYGEDHEA